MLNIILFLKNEVAIIICVEAIFKKIEFQKLGQNREWVSQIVEKKSQNIPQSLEIVLKT